ncbi:MAG TPA: hypothetical protein VE969_03530 [Pyrinomonadaceae bacterium]|nr:hypothetical protein [Pyrinomonadaceae bacterium]
MKLRNSLSLIVILASLSLLATVSMSSEAAKSAPSAAPVFVPSPTPPDYTEEPANTDGQQAVMGDQPDCHNDGTASGIGCENLWHDQAANAPHLFYLPPSKHSGRLLVFFNGNEGKPHPDLTIYSFAASRGYHVIGLSYFAAGDSAKINGCDHDDDRLGCYEDFVREVLLGTDNCTHVACDELKINKHPQDAVVNRLLKALEWAAAAHPGDGWERYLTASGEVDWTKINIAGWSNGSSFASLMGMLFPSVGRVTVFSGPNDGKGNSENNWVSADYIQNVPGLTDTRFYGLVHELNKAEVDDNGVITSVLYRITKNWRKFGMGQPLNASPFYFDPVPGESPDFGNAHMLISTNPTTDYAAAHGSVVYGRECSKFDDAHTSCDEFKGDWIGYDAAWRCVLGSGDASVNSTPVADAGPNQTVECQGAGGANVVLDGSRSTDADCDVLTYTWTGPFGTARGRNPQVFLPVGTNVVNLTVSDEWSSSAPSTTQITVQDTQPPSLQVTLTPTLLWPANHTMVRIDAAVSSSDSCGGSRPTVVLTSITSDQADDGTGDGDTAGDIQDAAFGTFDRSFLLRAERAGNDPRGRTYTVTYTACDASGNCTQRSATVRVPHSR